MICAMGAISVLGFIVWAQMGLLFCKSQVIKSRYMLENLYVIFYKLNLIVKKNIRYNTPICCINAARPSSYVLPSPVFLYNKYEALLHSASAAGKGACWKLSDQSAGNYNLIPLMGIVKNIGTSETIREISSTFILNSTFFSTSAMKPRLLQSKEAWEKKNYPKWFKDWLIGFAEGNGGFYCDRNAKRLYFKIRQADYKILYKIKHYFNFGSISHDSDSYFTYTVSKKADILTLIHVFNGQLVLNKTNDRFINQWLNNYNHWHNTNILYKGMKKFEGFNSAWLCGITDADGSFGFKFQRDSSRKYGGRVRIYWYIDQSYALNDLTTFKSYLNMGYLEKRISSYSDQPNIRYIVMNLRDCDLISKYFDTYTPLTSNKQIRFIRFKRVLNWCLDRTWSQHLDQINHLISLNKEA